MSTKSQVKICVDCKNEFEIDSGDLNLYEKVGLKIPEQCFFCRLKQYAAFWVFGKFRKGVSNLSGESLITVLPSTARYPIYKSHEWWGDAWNPIDFGQDYDPSKPFFEQLKELQEKIPHPHQVGKNNTNCDWCDDIWFSRNCYLTRAAFKCENLSYGYRVIGSKDSFDLTLSFNLQNSYDCLECHDSFNLSFSENSRDCIDSYFLYDCRNCQNCFMCWNLRNKRYFIRNKQYTKDQYEKEIKNIKLNSHKELKFLKDEYNNILKNLAVHRENFNLKTTNSTGNYLTNCDKCINVFAYEDSQNCRNQLRGLSNKDCIDQMGIFGTTEISGSNSCVYYSYGMKNSNWSSGRYSEYLEICDEVEYCFGCIGLRKKKYCILNKQYSKKEYEEITKKLRKHMYDMPYTGVKGRVYKYGEFFPPEFSPWSYNETLAQEYFPLTKEQAKGEGYRWRDPDTKNYVPTILSEDIPNDITSTGDAITDEVLECAHKMRCNQGCTKAFRILSNELQFYRKIGVSLPILCPACRTLERLKMRLGVELYDRSCMCAGENDDTRQYKNEVAHLHHDKKRCEEKFKTGYSPEEKDIVYCEQCYQQEVY